MNRILNFKKKCFTWCREKTHINALCPKLKALYPRVSLVIAVKSSKEGVAC